MHDLDYTFEERFHDHMADMNSIPANATWAIVPTVGQVKFPQHDHSTWLSNSSSLVNYVCENNQLGESGGHGVMPQFYYIPVCEFPYINKGWMAHGEPGFGDVEFNDCSIFISESFGPGVYDQQCLTMIVLALIPSLACAWFVKLGNDAKKKPDVKWFFPMKPNLNEKLLCISVFVGVFHAIRCIDPSGYAGRLQIKNIHTLATGFCVAGPIHVGLMLVTSWITIIDGGKKKRAPRWARVLYNLGVWSSYASELGLGLLEYRMPALNDSGALDGAITGVKYLVSVLWCVVYCILCFLYGMRISNMLKGKGEINPQAKRIRKMCRLGTVGFFFGALVKVFGVFGREFKICQTVTPCDPIIELMIPIFVYFLQVRRANERKWLQPPPHPLLNQHFPTQFVSVWLPRWLALGAVPHRLHLSTCPKGKEGDDTFSRGSNWKKTV